MNLHPLCSLFSAIEGEELDALVADIKANGLREPIVTFEGSVLDGRNRLRACELSGVAPTFEEFDGADAAAFVESKNLHRRHLTPFQRATAVALMHDWRHTRTRGGDGSNQHQASKPANLPVCSEAAPQHRSTEAERAARAGVSPRTQRAADKVAKSSPGLAEKVVRGEVMPSDAIEEVTGTRPGQKAKPTKKAKPAKAATEPVEENPDLGADPTQLLEDFRRDLEKAEGRVRDLEGLMAADDQRKKLLDMQMTVDLANRRRDEAMANAAALQQRVQRCERLLARCGKAVGERDLDRVAPAVEAMARSVRKVAV